MSAARTVRPTDLVALVSFDGRVYPNEARTWERLGCRPEPPSVLGSAVEQWFSFATGRHTWISIQGQTIRGLISARPRGTRAAWEVDCLIAAAADPERVALDLFERLSAGGVRYGAQKVFLRLEAGSDLIRPARKAGFVPYATERLLRLSGAPQHVRTDLSLPVGIILRPRERQDDAALFQLYNRVVPHPVRMVEAATLAEWQAAQERRRAGRRAVDLVGERDGRIVLHLRAGRSDDAGRLDLTTETRAAEEIDALVAWGLRELGSRRPVYTVVPGYDRPLEERLLVAGFEPAGEYELLAKRLAQPVRVTSPARAAVKRAVPL
jgi:hypothetical protein